MKRSELFFGALLVPIDYITLLAAGAVAYYIRLSPTIQQLRPAVFEFDLPFVDYMRLVAIVAAITVFIFATEGLYIMQVTRRALEEFSRIFTGISLGVMSVIIYTFLSAELFHSRFILIAAYVLAIVFVTFGRYAVKRAQQTLLQRGVGIHRVVLAGAGKFMEELDKTFKRRLDLGYRVVGSLAHISWEGLEEIYRGRGIDEIIQTDPTLPQEDNLVLLDFAEQYKIDYKYVPNMFETHAINVHYRQVGTIPLLELSRTPLEGWGRIAKRVIDIIGSVIGIIFLLPVFIATAIAIKLESDGPIFYKQVRIGRNMAPFEILKLRSMYLRYCVGEKYGGKKAIETDKKLRQQANERSGPLFKMRNDPRITKVGRFIRSWRIDELPQLINVLKGEMSLLGPRPHLPNEIRYYDKHHRRLFTIKPGMSGMAQVAGNAGLPFDEEAKIDIAYIENWSIWLDVILLIKTARILLFDKNAV